MSSQDIVSERDARMLFEKTVASLRQRIDELQSSGRLRDVRYESGDTDTLTMMMTVEEAPRRLTVHLSRDPRPRIKILTAGDGEAYGEREAFQLGTAYIQDETQRLSPEEFTDHLINVYILPELD